MARKSLVDRMRSEISRALDPTPPPTRTPTPNEAREKVAELVAIRDPVRLSAKCLDWFGISYDELKAIAEQDISGDDPPSAPTPQSFIPIHHAPCDTSITPPAILPSPPPGQIHHTPCDASITPPVILPSPPPGQIHHTPCDTSITPPVTLQLQPSEHSQNDVNHRSVSVGSFFSGHGKQQRIVFCCLFRHSGSGSAQFSSKKISAEVGLSSNSFRCVLARLQEKGLIEYEAMIEETPEGRKFFNGLYNFSITPAGRKIYDLHFHEEHHHPRDTSITPPVKILSPNIGQKNHTPGDVHVSSSLDLKQRLHPNLHPPSDTSITPPVMISSPHTGTSNPAAHEISWSYWEESGISGLNIPPVEESVLALSISRIGVEKTQEIVDRVAFVVQQRQSSPKPIDLPGRFLRSCLIEGVVETSGFSAKFESRSVRTERILIAQQKEEADSKKKLAQEKIELKIENMKSDFSTEDWQELEQGIGQEMSEYGERVPSGSPGAAIRREAEKKALFKIALKKGIVTPGECRFAGLDTTS